MSCHKDTPPTAGVVTPSEPEECARGSGTHHAGRGRHAGHSDDHLAHRFDATRSVTSPRWLKRRQNQGQLAGSRSDVQRRLRSQPLVCERRLYSLCTCVTRIRAVLPRTRTGSVGVTSRWQTADGRCSERPFPAVAVASDVERPVTEDVYLLYVSVPELRCRGTRLRRSTGSLLHAFNHVHPLVPPVGPGEGRG